MENTSARNYPGAALHPAYFAPGAVSFSEFLGQAAPDLLPGRRFPPEAPVTGAVTHGTTIVAATFKGGVLLAGDRRATQGNIIAQRDIEKVFVTDDHSAVGIAGVAGLAVELVRLFAVELEHYEKIEGVSLSLDGKANKLGTMVRGNLDAAMMGLAVLPLFVGFDPDAADPERAARIVSYDITGSRADEHQGYHAIGSGSVFAKAALKKKFDPAADADTAVRTAVEALYDAADDDTATGGPDLTRRIYPMVVTITAEAGATKWTEEATKAVAEAVVQGRMANPGG
ncbi:MULTISPECIES: proteasome subunit beta [unclassified Crossiella]|uniref:proteasome subunit beta n=1 Tax=unclassified Crossiella TaxID=2620835 RepID=UPI001FFF62FE|nr:MULTISPECIES: proteasome subunit beta [unclassified Crossiella]MCK2242979.1 proteasome subunit beta [Crossiella sp. S99.2]MCK2256856.1 proteasome subunit beta [Crossiella sp. S99.1]